MKPLFPSPPPPSPMPRDPDRAVLVRRALKERLLETLRHFGEEIEVRRVGGLGEAQAAGYVAGRLQRAEQQATVLSVTSGVGHLPGIIFGLLLAISGSTVAARIEQPITLLVALGLVLI